MKIEIGNNRKNFESTTLSLLTAYAAYTAYSHISNLNASICELQEKACDIVIEESQEEIEARTIAFKINNDIETRKQLQKLFVNAKKGDAYSCRALGMAFAFGHYDLPIDYVSAKKYFLKTALAKDNSKINLFAQAYIYALNDAIETGKPVFYVSFEEELKSQRLALFTPAELLAQLEKINDEGCIADEKRKEIFTPLSLLNLCKKSVVQNFSLFSLQDGNNLVADEVKVFRQNILAKKGKL